MSLDGRTVAVVGLGPMGRGIARVFAGAGARVVVCDITEDATTQGVRTIEEDARRDGRPVEVTGATLEHAAAQSWLLVEAIVEDMAAKEALLATVREHADADLVVASNTSSLSVGEMGRAFGDPGRVVGMHFFNPPTKMLLVEVIRSAATSPQTYQRALEAVDALGKTAVTCADSPNFIVNRVCRPLYYESQLLVADGVPVPVVDAVARHALGHRMGPLQLLDFAGLHTHLASSETAHREFGDPRYRPIPLVRHLVRDGMTGRAAGRGFYDYAVAGPREAQGEFVRAPGAEGPAMRVSGPDADRLVRAGITSDAGVDAADAVEVYACHGRPSSQDVSAVAARASGGRVVVDGSHPDWLSRLPAGAAWIRLHLDYGDPFAEVVDDTVAGVPAPGWVDDVLGTLAAASVCVPALPGLVADRLSACLVNEASLLVEEQIATAEDVDVALRLAMNHPLGPFEHLDSVGVSTVHETLRGLLDAIGDPRYRPSQLLRRRAAGESRRVL